jgi:hypothetical protein
MNSMNLQFNFPIGMVIYDFQNDEGFGRDFLRWRTIEQSVLEQWGEQFREGGVQPDYSD